MIPFLSLLAALTLQPEPAPQELPEYAPLVPIEVITTDDSAKPADEEDSGYKVDGWTIAKPALWKMEDKDTTIYLFGTVHLLPYNLTFINDDLEHAMDASDELVTETQRSWTMSAWAGSMAKAAFDPSLPPIKQRLDEEHHAVLDRAIKQSGFPESFFDKIHAWAASGFVDSLVEEEALEMAYSGAEDELERYFKVRGKSHGWLESWREQVGFLAQIDEPASIAMLESSLRDFDGGVPRYEPMIDLWSSGDVDGIAKMLDDDHLFAEGLAEVLLYQRNRNWVEWIEDRMDRPGTIFLAVGAGHLAGEKSVIDYLEQAGHTVTRIQ